MEQQPFELVPPTSGNPLPEDIPPVQPSPSPVRISGWVWPVLVVTLLLPLFLCALGGGWLVWTTQQNAQATRAKEAETSKLTDQFMQFMLQKKVDQAYALFSTQAQKVYSLDELKKFTAGSKYRLFSGYQKFQITGFQLHTGSQANPNTPQGEYAILQGKVFYVGGMKGVIQAILEHEGDHWSIYRFTIDFNSNYFRL